MKKKKIMIFLPYMPGYGGVETVISNLFEAYNKYDKNNCELSVVSIGGYGNGKWLDNVRDKKIYQLSQNKIIRKFEYASIFPFLTLYEVIKNKPDVVVSTSSKLWSTLYFWKKVFNLKYKVASWRHSSLTYYPCSNLSLKCADIFLAISTGIGKQLEKKGVPKDKIRIVYNPIKRSDLEIKRTLSSSPAQFVFVGRLMLNGQKNMKEMFDAFSKVHGDWILNIYGQGSTKELNSYIKKLGIQNHIKFQGFKQNLWSNVEKCDAVIMTSKFEGLPMALVEAISNGVPVISSDCETGPDDIVNVKNGKLYEPGNIDELSGILQKFVDKKTNYNDINSIKESINKFYSDNYIDKFVKMLN